MNPATPQQIEATLEQQSRVVAHILDGMNRVGEATESLIYGLRDASPYCVVSEFAQLITESSATLPDEWQLEPHLLHTPSGFAHFCVPLPLQYMITNLPPGPLAEQLGGDENGTLVVGDIAWVGDRADSGVFVMATVMRVDRRTAAFSVNNWGIAAGWLNFGDDVQAAYRERGAPHAVDVIFPIFATMLEVLRQRISHVTTVGAPRALRRRLGLPPEAGARVVHLRRYGDVSAEPGDGTPVEWSHRWISRAHWGRRWVGPRDGERRLIWTLIPASVKGPPDKPLVIREPIFAADR